MKQPIPNYEVMFKSAVSSLKAVFEDYKRMLINDLKHSWINDNGELARLGGAEQKEKIIALKREVMRLSFKVDEIRAEMENENDPKESEVKPNETNNR